MKTAETLESMLGIGSYEKDALRDFENIKKISVEAIAEDIVVWKSELLFRVNEASKLTPSGEKEFTVFCEDKVNSLYPTHWQKKLAVIYPYAKQFISSKGEKISNFQQVLGYHVYAHYQKWHDIVRELDVEYKQCLATKEAKSKEVQEAQLVLEQARFEAKKVMDKAAEYRIYQAFVAQGHLFYKKLHGNTATLKDVAYAVEAAANLSVYWAPGLLEASLIFEDIGDFLLKNKDTDILQGEVLDGRFFYIQALACLYLAEDRFEHPQSKLVQHSAFKGQSLSEKYPKFKSFKDAQDRFKQRCRITTGELEQVFKIVREARAELRESIEKKIVPPFVQEVSQDSVEDKDTSFLGGVPPSPPKVF